MSEQIKIIIADDHPLFRKGLKQSIEEEKNIVILGDAADGNDALELINIHKPDVAVLDIEMPGKSGLDVIKHLNNQSFKPKVILLTMHKAEDLFEEAMNLGIMGYVLKESATIDIVECINKVYENNYYISPLISNFLVAKTNRDKRVNKDLKAAHDLQLSLIPSTFPKVEGFEISGSCTPCLEVGGDWYDCFTLSDGRIGIVLADISGKGMEAALLMSSTRSILRLTAEKAETPGDVLTQVNNILLNDFPDGKFVTMIYAIIDHNKNSISFANAGHPPPLLIRNKQATFIFGESGFPLGVMKHNYIANNIFVQTGDVLIIYSDGLTDALNKKGNLYGNERLLELSSKENINVSNINIEVNKFADGTRLPDDLTITMIKCI